jgi:hypothetical protein
MAQLHLHNSSYKALCPCRLYGQYEVPNRLPVHTSSHAQYANGTNMSDREGINGSDM